MMLLWTFRDGFDSPARRVWVGDVRVGELAPIGVDIGDFSPVETRVVTARGLSIRTVGSAHFIDDEDRVWFVTEAREVGRRTFRDTECVISRYAYRVDLGYDVPADRSSQFGPPATWTWVDAAGVPVQVVRVTDVAFPPQQSGFVFFSLFKPIGDRSTVVPTAGVRASQRSAGGRRRDGTLLQGLTRDAVFSPDVSAAAVRPGSSINWQTLQNALVALGTGRGLDTEVAPGDFFVILPSE